MFGGIPFEHFAHGGGGGGGGRGRRPSANADTTQLYTYLGVAKDADPKELRKAYLTLSRKHHPDRGGDAQKFKEINGAYNLLKDPEKRAAYDKYGLDGVDEEGNGGGGGGGHGDIFSEIFGGRRSRGGAAGPKKGPPVNHPLKVSLSDVFNGKTVKLAVQRKVLVGDSKKCDTCNGQGQVMQVRQIGPGMIQQMQSACDECSGQGYMAKTKSEREVLEVHVEKGCKDGHKIQFRGKGDEMPGMEAGDINFVVQVKEHSLFTRKAADLLITKKVSLNQALCGFAYKFKHLDGREVVIKTKPGEIIQAEGAVDEKMMPFVKLVPSEGLPSQGNPFVKGNLYVLFRVHFPTTGELSPSQIAALKLILPEPQPDDDYEDDDEVEIVHMEMADLKQFGKGGAELAGDRAYDSDDEAGGGQPVQCQQS